MSETPQHPESPLAAALVRLAEHAERTTARVDEVDKKQSGRLVGVGGVVGVLVVLVPLIAPYLQPDKAVVEESVRAAVRREVADALDSQRRKTTEEHDALLREVKATRADTADALARCTRATAVRVDASGAP